ALSRNPSNGKAGIKNSMSNDRPSLPLQHRERVRVERLAMPIERNHDREPDGGLGRSHRHDEEHDDLPVSAAERPAERDERQVDGVQHDLDRQEDRDQVPAQEYARGPDREEHRRQDQIVTERSRSRHHRSSRRARTTAPTIATRISTEVTSNWKP